MRFFFWIIVLFILVMFGDKIVKLMASGNIFEGDEWKKSFHEAGKNVWWIMKTFVIVWFIYLVFIWWVRHR